jgi:hypothetical protein
LKEIPMLKHRAAFAAALVLLACLTASATASAITISPGGSVTSTGTLTFSGGIVTSICNVTLAQTLRAGTYSVGQQYGTLNSATVTGCSGGFTATVSGLPAPMFMGALNGTMWHKLVPLRFLITNGIARCLYIIRLGADYDGRVLRVSGLLMANLDGTQPLVTIPLCPTVVGATGNLVLAPVQTVTLP